MKYIRIVFSAMIGLLLMASHVSAMPVEITQMSLFLSTDGSESKQDDQLGYYDPVFFPAVNTFGPGGFDVDFQNNLGSDNYGSVSWRITNNTGSTINQSRFMGFLDAELSANAYWNEYGDTFGNVSSAYDAWEIDEPGYLFGDIYDNLKSGNLDDSNNVPSGWEDDVSLALGFDLDTWLAGETVIASFSLSDMYSLGQSGLSQFDMATNDRLFFSGSLVREAVAVPEPGTLFLLSAGLLGLVASRRRDFS